MSTFVIPAVGSVQAFVNAHARSGVKFVFPRGGKWLLPTYLNAPCNDLEFASDGNTALPKPLLFTTSGQAFQVWHKSGITVTDLKLASSAVSPSQPGLVLTAFTDVALNDIEVSGFSFGIQAQGGGNSQGGITRGSGLTLAGCAIHDNFNPVGHSSGMFATQVDGLTITGSVFHTNGWVPGSDSAVATVYNHGLYVCGDCGPAQVSGTAFANNSSHGMQARTGGHVGGNLFIDNAIGLSFGLVNGEGPSFTGGVSGGANNNVFIGGRDINGSPRGIAIQTANVKTATISGNLIANDTQNANQAIQADICAFSPGNPATSVGILDLVVSGNAVWDWSKGPWWLNPALVTGKTGTYDRGIVTVQATWAPPVAADLRAAIGGPAAIAALKTLAVTPSQLLALAVKASGR